MVKEIFGKTRTPKAESLCLGEGVRRALQSKITLQLLQRPDKGAAGVWFVGRVFGLGLFCFAF